MVAIAERSGLVLRIVTACAVVQAASLCWADTLTLQTGGLVRGRLSDSAFVLGSKPVFPAKESPAKGRRGAATITITTLTGGRLVLDASQVRAVTRRPLLLEEYEVRKRRTPEEIDALWKLAEWCRNRGLKPQREDALRRILVLDPDHVQAHQGLGQSRYDGQWKTHDEEMRSRGFVKFEGRYVAVQEIEILKKLHSRRRIEQDWTERVRNWSYALSSTDPEKRRRGRSQLLKIGDPNAIPALNKILRTSEDEERRALYVKILSRIPGTEAVSFLVEQSLFDASKAVRVDAQDAITPQLRDVACPLYAHELRNSDNEIVRRAGRMLEKIGDDSVVAALIEADRHDPPGPGRRRRQLQHVFVQPQRIDGGPERASTPSRRRRQTGDGTVSQRRHVRLSLRRARRRPPPPHRDGQPSSSAIPKSSRRSNP